ncbi:MAG: STAS domain-containing protein [Sulfitobacter sp.]
MAEVLSVEGRLDLTAVGKLHDDLLAHSGGDVVVQMDRVTQLGTLCVQTMIAAANTARANGHSFKITNTSDRVLGQLAVMGMTPETIMKGSQ